jgi:cyclic pyranopterin phosphate synthase
MPAAARPWAAEPAPATLEQLAGAVRWLAREHGVRRVKLTGGEPLVRSGVGRFVASIAGAPGLDEISLTTNGSLLATHAAALATSGLARVNVSLDSVDPARFALLSRGGRLQDTLSGIDAALEAGLTPLKLNAVLHRTDWTRQVSLLLDFAAARQLEIRFIELMRTGGERAWCESEFLPAGDVRRWLEERTPLTTLPAPASAPARRTRIRWNGCETTVGWITPRSRPFCEACDRLRLDARGRLRRCLMDPLSLPLIELLARGDDVARAVLVPYLAGKRLPAEMETRQSMHALGG